MVKEIVICCVIVISIFFGNYITQDYTKEVVSEITETLSGLRKNLTSQNIDNENVKREAEKINKNWKLKQNKLAYFIEHNELEKIETELVEMQSDIETGEYADSINKIDRSVFILEHVEDKYALNLRNIF